MYVDIDKELNNELDELFKINNQTRAGILLPSIENYVKKTIVEAPAYASAPLSLSFSNEFCAHK